MYGAPPSTQHTTSDSKSSSSSNSSSSMSNTSAAGSVVNEKAALQQHRASRIFAVMLFVTATYALLSVCIALWSNSTPTRICRLPCHPSRSAAADRPMHRPDPEERCHRRDSAVNANGPALMCRLNAKWKTLIKWHLLRNRDFIVVAVGHTAAYAAQSVPDIHFYSLVERHYSQKSGLTMVFYSTLLYSICTVQSVRENCSTVVLLFSIISNH